MIKPIIDLSARTLEYDTGKQAILEKYGKPSKNVTQVFAKRIAHVIKLAGVERTVVYYDNQQLKVDITEQSDAEKYYPDPVFQFDVRKLPFKEDPTYVNYLDTYVIDHRKLDWQNFNLDLDMIPRYYQPQGIPFDTLNWACDHESIDLYAKPETGASLRLIHYIDANVVDKAVEIDFDEKPKADRHFKINKENLDGFYELQSFSDSIVDIVTKANKKIIL